MSRSRGSNYLRHITKISSLANGPGLCPLPVSAEGNDYLIVADCRAVLEGGGGVVFSQLYVGV